MTTDELKKESEEYWFNQPPFTKVRDRVIEAYLAGAEPREKRIAELEKENAELKEELKKWKDEWQEQVQKATDEGYTRTLKTMQLTKAKELLKDFLEHYKAKTIYVENMSSLLVEAENFLKESEVEK